MNKIIKLNSRGEDNYLKQLIKKDSDEESKTYRLITESEYIRAGNLEGGLKYITPSGGPTITESDYIYGVKEKVKSISYVENIGYIITFE